MEPLIFRAVEPWLKQAAQAAVRLSEEFLPKAFSGASRRSLQAGNLEEEKALFRHVRDAVPFNDRAIEGYQNFLKMPMSELDEPGRLILDVGSGMQGLARAVRSQKLRSTIVSIEPRVSYPERDPLVKEYWQRSRLPNWDPEKVERDARLQQWALSLLHPDRNTVAAYSHRLPFADGTFDNVYASWSVPHHLRSSDEVAPAMSDMLRVLKPGGIARIAPMILHTRAVDSWIASTKLVDPRLSEPLLTFTAP